MRLAWPGRTFVSGAPSQHVSARVRSLEVAGDHPQSSTAAGARVVHGDCLRAVGAFGDLRGKVDLVYVDPPYQSDRDYVAEARLDGPIAPHGRVVRTRAYEDKLDPGAYLDMLAPRLDALASLLHPETGTLWVHLDWRAAYLVRAILDEIMGRDAFLNEIVWRRAPNLGRQAASAQFGRTLDTILVYGKPRATLRPPTRLEPIEPSAIRWDDQQRPFTTAPRGDYTDVSIARLEKEGRVHRTSSGRVYIKYFLVKDADGTLCRERRIDALWTDVPPLRHAKTTERTGYPTQKPVALLERIIACASPPGGLVVDGFAGSGTTGVAAHNLGRRSVLVDASPIAIATARARLLRAGAALRVDRIEGTPEPPTARARFESKKGLVRLLEPKEPLAWAVGRDEHAVFRTLWHGERTPGAKPIPAPLEARVAARRDLRVRVYGDDGSISEASP